MKKLHIIDFVFIGITYLFVFLFIYSIYNNGCLFGSNTDWISQHIVIPDYFRQLFYHNHQLIPSLAFNIGMGQNIFYFSYYGLLSPLILISYLFPSISMVTYIQIIAIIMLLISIFMLYHFIYDKYDTNIAFIATILFTLAGPIIYHTHRHIMFVIYMPFLIGALNSVDYYFRKKDSTLLIINTFLMIMSSYYFSIPGIIVIGIYTIYNIFKNNKKIDIKSFKPLLNVIYFVVVSILLAGVLLIPTFNTLSSGRLSTTYMEKIVEMFIPKVIYKTIFYESYSLGLTFIFIISLLAGFISKKKENIFASIALSLCVCFPVISYLLNGMMYVDGKCFIPFIPFSLLIISDFLANLFQNKININKLLLLMIPTSLFILYCGLLDIDFEFMLLDIFSAFIALLLIKLFKKPSIILIPTIFIALITFTNTNTLDNYVNKENYDLDNGYAYKYLAKEANKNNSSLYRTDIKDNLLNNVNKIYSTNEYISSMYSSSENKNYVNFMHNIFQTEFINKDNITITQPKNVLFNIYSGTKYMISSSYPFIGYNKIKSKDGIKLYENNDVLPVGYASNKIMSLSEFNNLSYPQTIDALLNYVIVKTNKPNVYKTNLKPYSLSNITSYNGLNIKEENNHYLIKTNSQNGSYIKINLNKEISNQVLIIKFKMNKSNPGYACSTRVRINGVTNALSCSDWKYYNHNDTFEYVLSKNTPIKTLTIRFSQGEYDISDINLYTMDYNQIKNIKKNIDEFKIKKINSNSIQGVINVKNDGYFKLTIPYEKKAFNAYVDGKKVKIQKVDTAFIGFPITKGKHTIEIKYHTPYLTLGIITSIIGLFLFIINLFYKKLKKYLIKIKNILISYIKWLFKRVIKFCKNNKGYILLFCSLYILDLALRVHYSKSIHFYEWSNLVPNLFSILWILLILNLTKLLKNKAGKILYLISYIFSLIMFIVHSVYYSYFKLFFDYKIINDAKEGSEYFGTVLLHIKPWIVIIVVISLVLTIMGLKKLNYNKKINFIKVLLVISAFILLHAGMPLFLGKKDNTITWDEWRNPRSIYNSFNDNNKSMMIAGMFEYNVRNFYVNYIKDNSKLTTEEKKIIKTNFKDKQKNMVNKYTGIFKNKNIIIVQMESIDSFLVNRNIMPNLYNIRRQSLNFVNHYSFTSGGGSTFNSEFMINTGYSTAYNTNKNAYLFSNNTYTYSLPNLLKKEGYEVNAFHMNSPEYYSRGVNYKAFGYDKYYSLRGQKIYKNKEYLLDRELINNKIFYNKIFKNKIKSLSYIITYTAHMPYNTDKGTCKMLTDQKGLTEYDCLKLQAGETDNFIGMLMDNIYKNNMQDNTIILFVTDHYLYTLEDKTLLDKYKETDNNLINHTPFMIWSNGLVEKNIYDTNSQLDILPTLLNLMGINYYPANYIGRDIMDNNFNSIVFFSDGSWYNGSTYASNGEYQSGRKLSTEKINYYNDLVKQKMTLNDAILKSDYYAK